MPEKEKREIIMKELEVPFEIKDTDDGKYYVSY